MDSKCLTLLLGLVLVSLVAAPTLAFADEPRLEVRSSQTRCDQPWEVTATGLEPSKPVEVAFVFEGQPSTAAGLVGATDAAGRFFSPIPRILLPCVEGGPVTATMKVDGKLLPVTARFVIAPPGADPTPPSVGNSPEPGAKRVEGAALVALATVLMLFSGSALALRRR